MPTLQLIAELEGIPTLDGKGMTGGIAGLFMWMEYNLTEGSHTIIMPSIIENAFGNTDLAFVQWDRLVVTNSAMVQQEADLSTNKTTTLTFDVPTGTVGVAIYCVYKKLPPQRPALFPRLPSLPTGVVR